MAVAAEYAARISVDTGPLDSGLKSVSQKLAGLGQGIPTTGLDSFVSKAVAGFNSLGASITGIGPLAAGMAVAGAAAIGMLAKHAFDAAVAFDAASDKIRIATGATGAQLQSLEGSFKTIFTSIPTSAESASEAISFLAARLNLSGDALEKVATTELELARITGSALGPQLEATTRLFKDWEISTNSQTTSLDFLFKVGQKTAIGVTDLSQRLVQFGAPLRQLGFSFEEAAVLIGKFQAEGVELNKALPGLRIALSKMANEGVRDAGDAFNFLIEKIQSAKTPMDATRAAIEIFGRRAGPDMAEAIRQGRFSVEELQKAIAGSSETIIGAAKDTNDFAEKWIILKNKASEALLPLGKLAFDALSLVTGAFSDKEDEIQKGWDKFWADMAVQGQQGINNLGDAIMNADKSPFFQAGASLGASVRAGFLDAVKGLASKAWSGEGFGGESEPSPIKVKAAGPQSSRWDWLEGRDPIQEAAKANLAMTAALKAEQAKAIKGIEEFRTGAGGAAKKAGSDVAKSLISGFQEGIPGLEAAFAKLDSSDLSTVFDKLGKKARAGMDLLKEALKVGAAAINEFAQSQGISSKITDAQVATMDSGTRTVLERMTVAYKTAHAEISRIEIEGLAGRKQVIDITIDAYSKMSEAVKSKVLALGATFHIVFPGIGVDVSRFSAEVNKASEDAAEALFKNGVGTKTWGDKVTAAFEKVSESAPHWAGAIVDAAAKVKLAIENSAEILRARAAIEMHQSFQSIVDDFIRLGEQSKLTGTALVDFAQKKVSQLGPALREGAQKALEDFKNEMFKLPGALDEVWNKLALGGKKQVSGLFQVIDSIPGKFGDSLRKASSTVQQWINDIDGMLKGLHKIFQQIPDGLAGVLSQLAGLFKSSTKPILEGFGSDWLKAGQAGKSAANTVSTSWIKAGDGVKVGASAAAGALASLTTAMSVTAATGSKTAGIVSSLFTSTLAGIQAGMAFGPVGGAVVGGISLISGIFGAIFGGGKSAAQKQQEALQLEKMKLDAQQTGQTIINTYLDGVAKALDLAPRIAEFEGVSKQQINKVFKFMTRIVDHFLDSAKRWTSENLKKGKEVAEAIGPVFTVMTAIPEAEKAINSSFGVSEAQIDVAFNSLDKIVERWSARAEQWGATQFKKIQKIAERIAPAINLFAPLIQAITDTQTVKEPTDEQLGIIDRSLDKIITMVGNLAEKFEKPFLKALQNLSEKVGPALDLWKSDVELLKATVDVPALKESDAENVIGGLSLFLDKLIAKFSTFNTEGLGRMLGVVAAITPVATALKTWLDTATTARGYTELGAQTWDAISKDFDHALDVLGSMANRGITFDTTAKAFAQYIASGAASLQYAFTMLSQIMNAAGALFPGGSPATAAAASTVGISSLSPTSALPSGSMGPSFFSGGSAASVAPRSAVSGGNVTINVGDVYLDGKRAPAAQAQEFAAQFKSEIKNWYQGKKARALSMNQQIPEWALE